MVLGNWGPGKLAAEQVARLEECIAHRFGWRRLRAALLSGSKGQRVAPAKA
jgi:transposase